MDTRRKDVQWNIGDSFNGTTWEQVKVAVLMDIRDELKQLNSILNCQHFLRIPHELRQIRLNTAKRRRPKRKAKK